MICMLPGIGDIPEESVAVGAPAYQWPRSHGRRVLPRPTDPTSPDRKRGPDLPPRSGALHVARFDRNGHRCRVVAGRGDDRVFAGKVGDETAVLGDEARAGVADAVFRVTALERVLNREIGTPRCRPASRGVDVEVDYVAGSRRSRGLHVMSRTVVGFGVKRPRAVRRSLRHPRSR